MAKGGSYPPSWDKYYTTFGMFMGFLAGTAAGAILGALIGLTVGGGVVALTAVKITAISVSTAIGVFAGALCETALFAGIFGSIGNSLLGGNDATRNLVNVFWRISSMGVLKVTGAADAMNAAVGGYDFDGLITIVGNVKLGDNYKNGVKKFEKETEPEPKGELMMRYKDFMKAWQGLFDSENGYYVNREKVIKQKMGYELESQSALISRTVDDYNKAIKFNEKLLKDGSYSSTTFIPGSTPSLGFQREIRISIGNNKYFSELHPAIDRINGESISSAGYMVIDNVNITENSYTVRFLGTNRTVKFMHIDNDDLITLNSIKDYIVYSPNQIITNFPSEISGYSSGPHVHLEERQNGVILNPNTHQSAAGIQFWWKIERQDFLGRYQTLYQGYY